MDEGSLILRQSFWHNCEEKGVNIGLAHLVDIRENCRMTINTDITPIDYPNYRTGVYIDAFGLNSTVILDFNFSADLESTNTPVRGVHLKGGNVGAGTNISIVQSSFSIHAKSSAGIFLDGSFPASSETHIFANSFATGNDGGGAFSYGVHMVGNKNNLNIYGNYFTGNGYTNYAIWGQSSNGINNYISDNYLEGYLSTSGDYFSFGFGFINFQNATICSNTNYFGSNNAFIFLGTDPGIDFRENKVYATAVALRIEPNSLIGPQAHNGNEWHPIVVSDPPFTITFRAAYHALCQPESADDNKFTVHTNQSIWNDVTSSYDFFSKFHPENIEPDIMDEFFAIQSGTPSSACITLLSESGDNELDKTIADGLLQIPSANPSMDWITKSYLYKKMKANPDFVDDYISYPTFLSDNANTNIGRFYEVSKKIENAFLPNDSLDVKSQEILGNINSLVGDLNQIDSLLETSTDEGEILSLSVIKSGYQEQVRNLQVEYDSVYETYWVEIVLTLQEAQVLNQQIMPTDQLESNEKAVTDIWLESVLNQGDSLTASQISELKSIGEQCPETGGLAVSYALGLLPECEKVGLDICTPEVVDDVLPLSFIHKGGQSLVDPPSSFKKSWLFPNPSTSVFYVEIPGGEAGELMITDLAKGKVIIRQPIESGIRVEVNQPLAPGVYLVKIRTTKGMEFTDKLIIQSK